MSRKVAAAEFDYNLISGQIRGPLKDRTARLHRLMKKSADDVIEIGKILIEVKGWLGHGEFRGWLKLEFGWSHDTASRYINIAQEYGEDPLKVSQIATLSPSILYLLVSPSTPEEARNEIFRLVEERKEEGKDGLKVKEAKHVIKEIKGRQQQGSELSTQPEETTQAGKVADRNCYYCKRVPGDQIVELNGQEQRVCFDCNAIFVKRTEIPASDLEVDELEEYEIEEDQDDLDLDLGSDRDQQPSVSATAPSRAALAGEQVVAAPSSAGTGTGKTTQERRVAGHHDSNTS
ncbi:MAG: DUF3102 domain-containing protein, partial [Acidobacteriota bacterium]